MNERRIPADTLIRKLNAKIQDKLDASKALILGVVLKGLPIAYSIARMNHAMDNLVPIVAHRPLQLEHYIESCLPSVDWESYLQEQLGGYESLIIIDDVVNSGFTKQKVESIAISMTKKYRISRWFAALILNRKNLAGPGFVCSNDLFALQVNASEVKCDWGTITVPLRDLQIAKARQRCDEYFQKHWLSEKRVITITY